MHIQYIENNQTMWNDCVQRTHSIRSLRLIHRYQEEYNNEKQYI